MPKNLLLVVRKSQRSDAAITGRVCVQQSKVEGPPDLNDAAVAAGQQVLAVAGHQNALKSFVNLIRLQTWGNHKLSKVHPRATNVKPFPALIRDSCLEGNRGLLVRLGS